MMEQQPKKNTSQNAQMQKKVGKYILFMNEDQILGKGQYGSVYRALDEQKQMYAVKMISMANFKNNPFDEKQNKNYEQIKREIGVMKAAKHTNLVTLFDIQQSPNNLYLVIEYCNGGNLKEYMKKKKKLSQEESINLFKQCVLGYKCLNQQNILHRDIKPENVMLHNEIPKLCDFGFGKIVEGGVNEAIVQSYKCTPIYAAPQVLTGEAYSSKCDVWSMGCMLYEMLNGYEHYPFIGRNQLHLIENQKGVLDKLITLKNQKQYDPLVVDILQKMLRYREQDRLSWEEVYNHKIMQKNFNEMLDEADEGQVDDGNLLNRSIFTIKKKLQNQNLIEDRQIYEQKHQPKSQQQSQQDSELKSMVAMQKDEQINVISGKVDKLVLYYRNQGIFASITMQNFWVARNHYQLENYLSHMIVYCLGGYYCYILEFLQNILQKQQFFDFQGQLQVDHFKIYLQSKNIQITKEKIGTDAQAAKEFFQDIEKSVLNEAQKTLDKGDHPQRQLILGFIEFVKKHTTSFKDYQQKVQEFIKDTIAQIDYKQLNHKNALKALNSLIIFTNIENHFPVNQYEQIDMKLFYEQQLNNPSETVLIQSITDYLSS